MDARSRIGPKMSAKTRPSNGLVRGQAANRKRSTTFTAANGKPKNSVTGRTASIRNSKFDASRLNFGGKGREALDLRNVLQDKKDEEERKKRFAANLQSRLGLQSRAAREEVKKQLNSARKVDSQKVTTTNTSKATAVKSSPTKTNVQNRQNTNERDARVSDIKRTAYKQSVAQARESLVNQRRNLSPEVVVLKQSDPTPRTLLRQRNSTRDYDLLDYDQGATSLYPNTRRSLEPFDHYPPAPARPPIVRLSPQFVRDVPQDYIARDAPTSGAQGHSILITNLNPMISKEDIQELFGDIGPIANIQAINPNTQLVTYFTRYDAEKARQVYHNRKLDDRTIYCTIVPEPSTSSNINTSMLSSRQSISTGRLYSDQIPLSRPPTYI